MQRKTRFLLGIALGISGFFPLGFSGESSRFSSAGIVWNPSVRAEDEGNEGRESGEERRSTSSSSSTAQPTTKVITRYETRDVTIVVDVTPEEYLKDTDGDGLVDAIDPHPTVPEQEFFTDTDGDGIPNAFDKHHDEDDFAYFDDTDSNNNGTLDAYEAAR